MKSSERKCSFCSKTVTKVEKLIVGAEGSICDYCVAMCYVVLENGGVEMIRTFEKVKSDFAKLNDQQ